MIHVCSFGATSQIAVLSRHYACFYRQCIWLYMRIVDTSIAVCTAHTSIGNTKVSYTILTAPFLHLHVSTVTVCFTGHMLTLSIPFPLHCHCTVHRARGMASQWHTHGELHSARVLGEQTVPPPFLRAHLEHTVEVQRWNCLLSG